jgi:hypothetical protein
MEPWTSEHAKWLVDTGKRLKIAGGKEVEVWELQHQNNKAVLSAWAKHFRNHYCLDTEIDFLRGNQSRQDYLNNIKFPCSTSRLGPSIRAGDFGEILIADYLQYLLGFWVPRVRWSSKVIRDESPKGSDVIGFRFNKEEGTSRKDILVVFEAKTKFSSSSKNRLQDAINGSAKDHFRIDESLNYIKQRLFERKEPEQAQRVERFQSPVDVPYQEIFGAAAIISDEHFDAKVIAESDCGKVPKSPKSKEHRSHPNEDNLVLLVIRGKGMMPLVRELYRRAVDEA